MTEKFQITEEQFHQMYKDCCNGMIDSQDYKDWKSNMRQKGYIRKSELQTLVDEAEDYILKKEYTPSPGETILLEALRALKKDHPEFKK